MARTLSDAVIVSMIEAATRLAAGRGPISGSGASHSTVAAESQGGPSGESTGARVVNEESKPETPSQSTPASAEREHDTRSAEHIGHDFRTIYQNIEEVVKTSAEQEAKSVGFGLR